MAKKASSQAGLAPRICPTCGVSFQPYREFHIACSRRCREKLPHKREVARSYHARPEVRERKNAVRRVTNNPERRLVNLASNLSRYGLTVAEFEALREEQGNRCAICGDQPDPNGIKAASRLHVDHCHTTDRNRALLCGRCNMGVGYFRDRPDLLREAADYIERHRIEV